MFWDPDHQERSKKFPKRPINSDVDVWYTNADGHLRHSSTTFRDILFRPQRRRWSLMRLRLPRTLVALSCGLILCLAAASASAASRATRATARVSGHGELTVTLRDGAATDRIALYVDGRMRRDVATRAGKPVTVRFLISRGKDVVVSAIGQRERPHLALKLQRDSNGRATDSTGSDDPSGEAMPVGNLPGWRQVFSDDFTGNSLDSCWFPYNGVIPSSPTSMWAPSHVSVSGGEAVLSTYQDPAFGGTWTAGGISSAPCLSQEYGKYEVRFRMDQAPGVKYAILLWPSTEPWPCGGEIDFGEDQGGDRSYSTLTDKLLQRSRAARVPPPGSG